MLTASLLSPAELGEAVPLLTLPQGGTWKFAIAMPSGPVAGLAPLGQRVRVVVVRDAGRAVAVGVRAVKAVRWCGQPASLGYLAMLRRDPNLAPHAAHRGLELAFSALAEARAADELPFDLTAIAIGNGRARRLLTAGLRGLPTYQRRTTYRARIWRRGRLARSQRGCWHMRAAQADDAQRLSLLVRPDLMMEPDVPAIHPDLQVIEDEHGLVACGRLVDQRNARTTVVAAMPGWISALRPLINPLRACIGRASLPRLGARMELVFLTDWRWRTGHVAAAQALAAELSAAVAPDFTAIAAGWSDDHPDAHALGRMLPVADTVAADWYTVGDHPTVGGAWHLEAGEL